MGAYRARWVALAICTGEMVFGRSSFRPSLMIRWLTEQSSFPAQVQRLSAIATEVQGAIDRMVSESILAWAATSCQSNPCEPGRDRLK